MKALEKIESLKFTDEQDGYYKACVSQANNILSISHEKRMQVSDIYINLHRTVFGENHANYRAPESKILMTMFANDIGINYRAMFNWLETKLTIGDFVSEELREKVPYSYLLEAKDRMKANGNQNPEDLVRKIIAEKSDDYAVRVKFLLRYSSELLTSCRKFRPKYTQSELVIVNEIKHRLKECMAIMDKKDNYI